MLSQRARAIEPSATLAVNSLRLRLQAEGHRIYNFGTGEPDFPTPNFICAAAVRAIHDGWTRYTPVAGVPALRAAVARSVGKLRGEVVTPEEAIVTSGGKQACFELLQALVDDGDEVLLASPYWVSYPEMVRLCDGIPVVVPTRGADGYRLRREALEDSVTPRTTGIILNSPSNPTGAVYSQSEITELVDFAESHDLWILSDEIYDRLVFDGEFVSPFSGRGRSRTIICGGASKTYSMTGWRLGWAVGSPEIISAMARLQSHTASNATAVSQAAAIAALEAEDESFLDEMVEAFDARRRRAMELLTAIDGLRFATPRGAFYIFLDLSRLLGAHGRPESAASLCKELLEKSGVALVPGEAFGEPQGARLSYACSLTELEEGIAAMASHLGSTSAG